MKRWVLWAGLLISALLLVYALRGLRLAEFWRDLQQADLRWLAPGIALYFAAVYCRAWRWAYLLRPLNAGLTARGLYPTVVIGYMGNNIYPARIGEVLKAWILRKDTGVPMPSSLATVIIERVMDGLAMVAFVLIGLPNVPALGATALRGVTIALVLFLADIAVFFWLALAPETAARLAGIVIQKLAPARARAPLTGLATQFLAGTRSLSRPRDLAFHFAC